MSYEIKGKIHQIMDTQTFPSGFCKREFVIDNGREYQQHIKLECLKDNTALLDGLREGQEVTVKLYLNGSEYNGKYYNNLVAFEIEVAQQAGDPVEEQVPEFNTGLVDDPQDDLVF